MSSQQPPSRDTSASAISLRLAAARRRQGRSGSTGTGSDGASPPAATTTATTAESDSSGAPAMALLSTAMASRDRDLNPPLHTPDDALNPASSYLSSTRKNPPASGAVTSTYASSAAAPPRTSTTWSATTTAPPGALKASAQVPPTSAKALSSTRQEIGVSSATLNTYSALPGTTPARSMNTPSSLLPSRAASDAAAAAAAAAAALESHRKSRSARKATNESQSLSMQMRSGAVEGSSSSSSTALGPTVEGATRTPVKSNILLHGDLSASRGGNTSAQYQASMASTTTATKSYSSLLASTLTTHRVSQQQQEQRAAATNSPTRSTDATASSSMRSRLMLLNPGESNDNGGEEPNSIDPREGVIVTVDDHERWLRESISATSHWSSVPRDAACLVSGCQIQIFTCQATPALPSLTLEAVDGLAEAASRVGSASVVRYFRTTNRPNDDSSTHNASRVGLPNDENEDDESEVQVDTKGVLSLPTALNLDGNDGGSGASVRNNNTLWEVRKSSRRTSLPYPYADSDLVCFGDIVTIRACADTTLLDADADLVLSVGRHDGSLPTLSLNRAVDGAPDQEWVVVRSIEGPAGLVLMGESALRSSTDRADEIRRSQTIVRRSAVLSNDSPFVRTGNPLLLRSCANGGILATGADGSLVLLTDSYDSLIDRSLPRMPTDSSLMDRLRRHHVLSPTDRELFYFAHASVSGPLLQPRCDNDTFCARSYQVGAHMVHQGRHDAVKSHQEGVLQGNRSVDGSIEGVGEQFHNLTGEAMQQPASQELLLLNEVLGSFAGLEGKFIRARSHRQFGTPRLSFHLIDDPSDSKSFDLSLRNVIEKELLPLSSSYANVRYFVGSHLNKYEHGSVMQALGEQLEKISFEYVAFINSLETRYRDTVSVAEPTVLKQLLADVRPTVHKMKALEAVVESVAAHKGGSLINALERIRVRLEGDVVVSKLVTSLIEASAVPFMSALNQWITSGVLNDPYDEFMIRFDPEAKVWEKQYAIVEEHVLSRFFPSYDSVSKVIATGRFWNAIRMCNDTSVEQDGISHNQPVFESIAYGSPVSDLVARVQVMHGNASQALVNLLIRNYDLPSALRITKRYFLLDQGDFFVRFMDASEDELLKDAADVSLGRVQHWLTSAITLTDIDDSASLAVTRTPRVLLPSGLVTRFTTKGLLSHLDKLLASPSGIVSPTKRVVQSRRSDLSVLSNDVTTGLDTFLIDFQSIPFPLSLILTRQAMASYQLLFRHLFYAKYVERRLVGIWLDHQALRELQSLRGALGGTFLLRQRMLHFVQNLIYYVMLEVIEPNWIEFEKELLCPDSKEERSVDDISAAHTLFLRKTLEACLMTNRDVLSALTKLLGTCLLFTNEMKTFIKATKLDDDRRALAKEKRSQFHRALNERHAPGRSSLSRAAVEKILIDDIAERKTRVRKQTARVTRELSSESYRMMVSRFDEVFTDHLREFMLQLKYADGLFHSHKVNLCTRLDYNGFVSKALGLSESLP